MKNKIQLQLDSKNAVDLQYTDKLIAAVKKELGLADDDQVSDQEIAKVVLQWTVSALDKQSKTTDP